MNRLIQPELLDALPPGDPRALHSRRDLHRINWWMGNHAIMARALQNNSPGNLSQITEIGAGDGRFLLRVVQKLSLSRTDLKVTLLDQQRSVSTETLTAFSQSGCCVEVIVTDILDWKPAADGADVILANMFLHHFENPQLAGVLEKISRRARLFVAIEPHRFLRPALVAPLLRLIGCNDVTRHDAAVSIRAGFAGPEISVLWPDKANWRLTERRAGLFSHLFIARRRE